ncbi:MAG: uL23 family ribosomal protein [Patescibacteria group bacterium]
MALFSRKKQTAPADASAPATEAAPQESSRRALPTDGDLSAIIVRPRITEKAVTKSEQNVHTFLVRREATKHHVRAAIKALYNVTPVKVNIVNKRPTTAVSRLRGTAKHVPGQKKAYVYLKEGDTINLV